LNEDGKKIFKNGDIYDGEFKLGYVGGRGEFTTFATGAVYTGSFYQG
jgi:hypothetical protein